MADRQSSYPDAATHGGDWDDPDQRQAEGPKGADRHDRPVKIVEALERHDDDLAAAVEATDELADVLATAILIVASADEDDIDHLTDSTANLVRAADGLTTDAAAELAETVGEDADDLAAALKTVLELQRAGHLDDLVALAGAFSDSLSPAEVEELARTLEDNGSDLVDALDVVLELHRGDHLEDLVELATVLSTLSVDEDTATGLNRVLSAVGEAERESEPVSLLGMLRGLRSVDARAGLGYLLTLLKAQGRRLQDR